MNAKAPFNSSDKQIAVIGCAIAGLSAALGSAEAGHHVTLFGQMPDDLARAFPGALQLAPNGFAALEALGALTAVREDMTRLHAIEIRSARSNATLSVIDHDMPHHRDYASIGRASLVRRLAAMAANHPLITFADENVKQIIAHETQTSLVTDNGTTHHFDLIIGADGKEGLTRRIIGASSSELPLTTRFALRAMCPSDSIPRHFSAQRTQLWLGDGYHLVSYPYCEALSHREMVNFVLCTSDKAFAVQRADYTKPIERLFAINPLLTPLCDSTISWHCAPLPMANQLATWRKYGVIVTGDAAHFMPPHLAQGAGQTLEDAAELKTMLNGANNVKQAAANWALSRQRALSPIIRKAETTGAVMRLTGPFAKMRNAALELGGQRLIEKWLNQVWQ